MLGKLRGAFASLPAMADAAVRLRDLETENRRLRSAVEELSILNEVASAVSSASTFDAVVDLIVQKCMKHLLVEQAAVLLLDEKDNTAGALHTMVRRVQSEAKNIPYRLGDQLVGWMLKHQAPLLINDLKGDGRFYTQTDQQHPVRSLMCSPLRSKGRMIGVLSVFNKRDAEGFTESDQRLLTIIASQSAQVIENARLYEEEKALQLVQQELQLAHTIQARLLPQEAPAVPGYEIAGSSVPAQNVGGDYFDFIRWGQDRLAICLGDVSGKGIPAAVLMASVQATIRGQTLMEAPAAVCLSRSNELLYRSTDAGRFVTLFYGVLDLTSHRLHYSNAGHNPPILLSGGSDPQLLTAGGPVLGVLPAFDYEEAHVDIQPGDLLVTYSDGFTEAMDLTMEQFGEERFLETLQATRQESVQTMVDSMFAAVAKHCGKAPQSDDMTIVMVRRTA